MESLNRFRPMGLVPIAVLIGLLAFSCSSGPTTSGLSLVDPQGNHPANFLSTHPAFAVADVEQCRACHGDTLTGGIANTSCFTAACHHGTIPAWASPASHGAEAKKAPGSSGFASCQICHGSDFGGGGAGIACADCHGVPAPHPGAWLPGDGLVHTNTDPANAPVCALCHFNEPAAGNHPPTPPPPGSSPGCFNNTLCHGLSAAPHALGPTWRDPAVGQASFHGLTARQDLSFCQGCHGTPGTIQFNGGIAPTSCASCHPEAGAHPIRWFQAPQSFPGYVPSHRPSGNRDVACAICHDVTQGRTPPDPAAPSCFSASFSGAGCHAGGPGSASHAVPFLDTAHRTVNQAGFDTDCSSCHAATGTSPLASAPNCVTCHTSFASSNPLATKDCTSCHAKPPAGTAYPNIAGGHAAHDALQGITGLCGACHSGLDSTTQAHYDRANARPGLDALRVAPGDAAFQATYNANAGAASFNATAFTCGNVSCHGGQTTPHWRTGTIDVSQNAGCVQCHTVGTALGQPEDNSPFSGLHSFHVGSVGALCTECHGMANGTTGAQNHFRFLDTPQMEGPASDTVTFPGLAGATYDAGTQNCTLTCHGQNHTAFSWSGAGVASHAVPFLDTAHTAVTGAFGSTTCSGCHVETGTASGSIPTCTTCHQAASPLAASSCTSCHASPPAGAVFPNIAGTHSGHLALDGTGSPVSCSTCHNGLDSGTQAHYDRANARPGLDALRVAPGDAVFLATYNARSGAATFNATAFTCSSVSCHGGQTTPNWRTGTIDVDTQCTLCHQLGTGPGTPQYNVYWSGEHNRGPHVSAGCAACHNVSKLADAAVGRHFLSLSTTALDVRGSVTIGGGATSVVTYDPGGTAGTGTCTPACHGTETW